MEERVDAAHHDLQIIKHRLSVRSTELKFANNASLQTKKDEKRWSDENKHDESKHGRNRSMERFAEHGHNFARANQSRRS